MIHEFQGYPVIQSEEEDRIHKKLSYPGTWFKHPYYPFVEMWDEETKSMKFPWYNCHDESTDCKGCYMCGEKNELSFKSEALAPAMLFVCRESRDIAAGEYTKAFEGPNTAARIWFDLRETHYISTKISSLNWYRGTTGIERNCHCNLGRFGSSIKLLSRFSES